MKLNVKVLFDDGDSSVTAINATADRVISYYLGNLFVLDEYLKTGKEEKASAVSVEFLDRPVYAISRFHFTLEKAYIVPESEMKKYNLHYPVRIKGWKTTEENERFDECFAYAPGSLNEEPESFEGNPVTEQEANR